MFFRYFPTISYNIDNYNSVITDITVAFLHKRLFLSQPFAFRRYTILEGETPEAVSEKLYGSVRFHWALMVLNHIVDPMTEWFMSSDLVLTFTEAKYPEILNDPTRKSGMYGINQYRFYYDEKNSNNYYRLDEIDEDLWRYRGGRNYSENDQIIVDHPGNDGTRATAYINKIGDLGEITDVVITNRGVGYKTKPNFTIISENGSGLKGEFILDDSEELQSFRILPMGEQIYPITNLHYETEININRREIIAVTKEHINFFEEQLYKIIGSY